MTICLAVKVVSCCLISEQLSMISYHYQTI